MDRRYYILEATRFDMNEPEPVIDVLTDQTAALSEYKLWYAMGYKNITLKLVTGTRELITTISHEGNVSV